MIHRTDPPTVQVQVSPYLMLPVRTLREACESTGRFNAGKSCCSCVLRVFCEQNRLSHMPIPAILRIEEAWEWKTQRSSS